MSACVTPFKRELLPRPASVGRKLRWIRTTPLVQPLSLCGNRGLSLLYDFLCACIITGFESENKQPSLNTFTSFQPIPSFHNLLQSITTFSQPILFLHSLFTPSHHQNPPKPSREKGKSIAAISRKKSRSERQLSVNQIGSLNFQRYFFPL